MNTKVLGPAKETYQLASEILAGGGLVAFPTETVYGLGANALDRGKRPARGQPSDCSYP